MTRTATVNYHVHAPTRQAYHIDAGGVVGEILSPTHAVVDVPVLDARSETTVSFDKDGIAFLDVPTAVKDFDPRHPWQKAYDRELDSLLKQHLGAKEVVVFDHTLRVDDPASDRRPARNVHGDYSPQGAEARLAEVLGAARAKSWDGAHFAFINVWRPVENPINSAPLGFVRPSSARAEDWILIDLIYPDRRGHIMGLVANPDHEWIYRSRMSPDEVAIFNVFDSHGRAAIGHSALDMVEDPNLSIPRKSIESRTLIRY